ncbi:GNAT family N-acetyltransferase [Saxibacter everestensis]|uniref:GNAT family N-acetyltransferase n=1 Tax=Saxibacter everestensis TaxID=2909229 RepID=A0ABY8QX11_9MICO|nr:GNAT family N-acetyltransferase [Brevibacteriaceae bacterium ZFBP1038]
MLIRAAGRSDALPLSQLLNRVVDEGDKTAIDSHLTDAEFAEWFLTGDHCLSCTVAQNDSGSILGFQALERFHDDLPEGMADIATFVSADARGKGIGTALIDATVREAQDRNITSIRAVIRNSNQTATYYYRSIGFNQDISATDSSLVVLTRQLSQ